MTATLFVCTTCRGTAPVLDPDAPRPGALLAGALAEGLAEGLARAPGAASPGDRAALPGAPAGVLEAGRSDARTAPPPVGPRAAAPLPGNAEPARPAPPEAPAADAAASVPAPAAPAATHAAPNAPLWPAAITLRPVECLSACQQGCAVALSAPGKWTYVYGRLSPDDAPAIIAGAALYAASVDGVVPWRERPEIFRKQSLARVPSLDRAPSQE